MGSLEGSILCPRGWLQGRVTFDARIGSVTGEPVSSPRPPFILPGFVDLHNHGGGGADVMAGAKALAIAARLHARHGTTSMLATSVTAPAAEIAAFLADVASAVRAPAEGAARILGAHLEGPFINPGKLGAQPPHAIAADAGLLHSWAALAPIAVVTFAPECDPDEALFRAIQGAGARAQIGHSLCDYAEARRGIARGCGVTHLFNAMSPVAHRGNGIAGAALAHADFAEVIPDLVHVEPGAILAARRAIPNLYGVTDATAAAGMPDGDYRLGAYTARKTDGVMRLPDGTLAGSSLTMDAALRNLVSIGLPLAEAARRLSQIPASWIGRSDIGRTSAGGRADLVVLDEGLRVVEVRIAGRPVRD
jgi:N-acetylglucosamine-6-phosphate deacetylase